MEKKKTRDSLEAYSCAPAKSVEDTGGERHYPHFSSSLAYPAHPTFVIRATSYCASGWITVAGVGGVFCRRIRRFSSAKHRDSWIRLFKFSRTSVSKCIYMCARTCTPRITALGRNIAAFLTYMRNVIAVPCLRRDNLNYERNMWFLKWATVDFS